ncbi:MAG: undecaprenyldiphospho-muramoylpentapeptide beta-N-acetylglucosaminyltransferase [Deltaproteobacteria bacterium]
MKLIIAGGGTGGHIFPAISVAEEFLRRGGGGNEILFVGTRRGMEGQIIPRLGFSLKFISSGAIAGGGVIKTLGSALAAAKGIFESARLIRDFKPDVVLGVGGYASGPTVLAAWALQIPTAICEQNSVPGITNRILGRFVKGVFATFETSVKLFPSQKTTVTGNPVRREILIGCRGAGGRIGGGVGVLVFGGSQGAGTLNASVPAAIALLKRADINVIHQTGHRDLEEVKERYRLAGAQARVLPFIENMADALMAADLAITRAGAGTIAEITAAGLPAILVPYPFAANNHQLQNARAAQRAGAAAVVEDRDATPERLAQAIGELLEGDNLRQMGEKAAALAKPDAARDIVDRLYKLARA